MKKKIVALCSPKFSLKFLNIYIKTEFQTMYDILKLPMYIWLNLIKKYSLYCEFISINRFSFSYAFSIEKKKREHTGMLNNDIKHMFSMKPDDKRLLNLNLYVPLLNLFFDCCL